MAARRREASRKNWPKNLYQNSQGYYWYRNPETGKTYGLGTDFKVAALQVKTVNAELTIRSGNASLLSRVDSNEKTLEQWCDEYIEPLRKEHAGKRSLLNIEREISTIRDSEFGKKKMRSIEPRDIVLLLKSTEERGPTVARAIRFRAMNLFREAINQGIILAGQNPVESTFNPKRRVTRARLSLDEFSKIVAEARKDPGYAWAVNAFELALVTGQRREDIATLKFSDVADGFVWIKQTKTKMKLKIPVSLQLASADLSVEGVIRRCRDNVVSNSVIHTSESRGGGKVGSALSIGHLSNMFAKFRDDAGIVPDEGKTPTSFHEIRSLSARLFTKEYGAAVAQAILGHKSSKMTDVYRDSRGSEWMEVNVSKQNFG
jgi:integrase